MKEAKAIFPSQLDLFVIRNDPGQDYHDNKKSPNRTALRVKYREKVRVSGSVHSSFSLFFLFQPSRKDRLDPLLVGLSPLRHRPQGFLFAFNSFVLC
jgi:hypothetical protein